MQAKNRKSNIYIYIRWAFGPTACRDPLWMVQWSKGPTFHWSWGPLPPRNLAPSNGVSAFGDALALHGSILSIVGPSRGRPKMMIFGIAPKRPQSKDKSNMGGPCPHFGPRNMTFEVPFGILLFFRIDQKARKVFVFQYFSMVLDHQIPLIFRLVLHCFCMFFQNCPRDRF